MSFLNQLEKETSKTLTENGGAAYSTTLNANLDFFALGGAKRGNIADVVDLFNKAYKEDKQLAIRTLFYLRDIKQGQGERDIFRYCLNYLNLNDLDTLTKIVKFVPEYGRWDDILPYYEVDAVVELVKTTLLLDMANSIKGKNISLLAKWMPSINASSKQTRYLAQKWIKVLDSTNKDYRKNLSELRKYIDVLEVKMSSKRWDEIDYSKVPSQAFSRHIKSFYRNDGERIKEHFNKVEKGEAKLNTSTLYCYEIARGIRQCPKEQQQAFNLLWKELPDFTNNENALVVADVSGSMTGTPMDVSVSLAVYFAERNKGLFANKFMLFSNNPILITIPEGELIDKLKHVEYTDISWYRGTNLQAVFDTILEAAVKSNASQEELPSKIYIITDMEFDTCTDDDKETVFENAKRKFSEKGYNLPHVIFWNADSRQNTLPVTMYDNNVTLISGASQNAFKFAVEDLSPIEFMLSVVNSDRYSNIVID